MKSVPVVSEIGFSDSEIESYRKESDVVQVVLKGWNEGRIQVAFTSVIRLLDSDASGVHELQEYVENTEFLQSALDCVYESVPGLVPYHHYCFVNVEGESVLEVVAESVKVSFS